MQKLYSELIGLPVFDEYSNASLGLVRELMIDPENGKVLAFVIKNKKVIVPLDIEHIDKAIMVQDKDRILPMDEVLRVSTVSKMHIEIIGARVITENTKTYLGRVVDYAIDTTHMTLSSIYVARVFLFFRFQERIINFRNIVRITQKNIAVKDSEKLTVKDKSAARSTAFAA